MASVKMLQDAPGSPDGVHVFEYRAGEVYGDDTTPRVSPQLADLFISHALAQAVADEPEAAPEAAEPKPAPEKRATKPAGPAETKAEPQE